MRHFSLCCMGVLLVLVACEQIDTLRFGEMRQMAVYESATHAAFPSVVRLGSGELLSVFREGRDPIFPDGVILLCRSKDGGLTWTPPDTIVSSSWDCRDPSITQLKDGLILVNFTQSRYDERGPVGCFTVRSFDHGKTFTAPRMVRLGDLDRAATSDAVLELKDGTLVMPVYGSRDGEGSSAWAVISQDGGETWPEAVLIAGGSEDRLNFYEPALVRLPDERLLCMLKTDDGGFLYQTVSEDGVGRGLRRCARMCRAKRRIWS